MQILVVEDSPSLRKNLADGLRESGFTVEVASDGSQGLRLGATERFDAIILDIMLPKMEGTTVLRELRKKGCDAHILLLTARDTIEDRVSGLNYGADDYLPKPFAFEELIARIRAGIRRRYLKTDPVIRTGPLVIDTVHETVTLAGRPINLTAREFALLKLLAMRLGEPVSRTMIWDELYDDLTESTSNVVDVYIGYLRRKLDQPGKASLIETLRGRGYRLRELPCDP